MHSPHIIIWQLSVYEWWIICVDNSTMYSSDHKVPFDNCLFMSDRLAV